MLECQEILSIGNKVCVKLYGQSPLIDRFLKDFSIYKAKETLSIKSTINLYFSEEIDPSGFKIMFHPRIRKELLYDKDYLIIDSGRGLIKVTINPGQPLVAKFDKSMSLNELCYPYLISVFQSMLRQALIPHGGTVLHASAAGFSRAIIFTAWQHTGKTDLMLYSIKCGASYLSDDHIIILDKKAYSFPIYLNLFDYNFRSHPWLIEKLNRGIRIKYKLDKLIRNALQWAPRKVRRAYEILFPSYRVLVNPRDLGLSVEEDALEIGALILLERAKRVKKILVKEGKISKSVARKVSINISLEDIAYNPYVIQYGFPQFHEYYEKVQEREIKNILENFSDVPVYHIILPENGLRGAENISCLEELIKNISESV